MPAFDAGHPLLAHAGSIQVAVFSHPTSISDITPPSQITLSPHFNITFVPYTQYWRDRGTAQCLALRGAMWRFNQCTLLLSITVGDIKSYMVFFFTGPALKALSIELVPSNKEKWLVLPNTTLYKYGEVVIFCCFQLSQCRRRNCSARYVNLKVFSVYCTSTKLTC